MSSENSEAEQVDHEVEMLSGQDGEQQGPSNRVVSETSGLIGDRSAHRLWAADVDFLLAAILAMVTVICLPDFDPLLKGLMFYVFYLLYFQLTEFYWGTTLAKWWFRLCVRDYHGKMPTATQIGIRTLFRIVEVNPMFFGAFPAAIVAAVTTRHVRIGDLVARTVVVRIDHIRPKK